MIRTSILGMVDGFGKELSDPFGRGAGDLPFVANDRRHRPRRPERRTELINNVDQGGIQLLGVGIEVGQLVKDAAFDFQPGDVRLLISGALPRS